MNGLFEVTRTKGINRRQDYLASIDNDEEVLFPILTELGFDVEWLRGRFVRENIPSSKIERYASWDMRLMLRGAGKLLKISDVDFPDRKVYVQSFTIPMVAPTYLKNYPVFNIPGKYVEQHQGKPTVMQMEFVRHTLDTIGIHFLIITKTGQYWFGRYTDIPKEQAYFTYKNVTTKRPDRLATKMGYQIGKFHSIKASLKKELIQAMDIFRKNHEHKNH